ncbi:MAG TPA: sigma-70 family RNA polymerase sigma factor [Actinomycetota bacterium]|nr:sigma-70 family RNA polymerase sigma factor [Actinomycetota bacterium]
MDKQGTSLSNWPDRDLVVAFKGGVPGAYEEMYRRYSDRVHGVCRRMLCSPEDAREATQETFLKAYVALPRFNGEYKLGAWLQRIASNVCVDYIRRRGRTAVMTPLQEQHESLNTDLGPEDVVIRDVPALQTLDEIQPLHAEALRLRNLQGLSHREIAAQLGMSSTQVKALLHRARASFKRAWGQASGWVLAPVATLRSLLDEMKHSGTVVQVPAVTQVTAPLLAEKMTATAMVVVVAFGGAVSVASDNAAPGRDDVPASESFAVADGQTMVEAKAPRRREVAAARPARSKSVVDQAVALVAQVKETAEQETTDDQKEDDGKRGGEDDFDPLDDRASGKLIDKLSAIADEVLPDK